LANQGILICLNSKNNPKDVLDVLKNHPHCLLKEHHIVGFKINWENKVQNLVELAQELNLGIDSFVFVDDSDTECALVRKALEQVTVIQTPKKLYLYQECLLKEGYFDKLTFSQEDQKRTEMYKTDQKRGNAAKNFVNMEEFLSSLELEVFIHPMTEQEIPRVAQLSQKTNQFNLTTKRYSDADIGHFYTDPKIEIYTLSVKDKFGPYGLTGMMVVRIIDKTRAIVDSCLLSCRILGRRLELLFVGYVLEHLTQKYNISEWKAEFFKTKKNEQVEFFWEKFNFEWDQKIEGFKSYHLNSPDLAKIKLNYIKINED